MAKTSAAAVGREDWATDAALKTAAGRRAVEAEIEAAITAWTSARDLPAPQGGTFMDQWRRRGTT